MSTLPPAGDPKPENELRAQGLQLAASFAAALRTGRVYAVGNPVFSQHLEQMLEAMALGFRASGHVRFEMCGPTLELNGIALLTRRSHGKFVDQLREEFRRRSIEGLLFEPGLALPELETFMRFFLTAGLYRGADLLEACDVHKLAHVRVMLPEAAPVSEPAAAGDPPPPPGWDGAMASYDSALHDARILLTGNVLRSGMELRHLKRVAHPLVDAVLAGEGPVALSSLRHGVQYACVHAVQVCFVAVAMGRQLGLDRQSLAELSVAALLHDTGKDGAIAPLARPQERWTDEDWAAAEHHTLDGLERLARALPLNASTLAAMRAAFEHHAQGPDGYPPMGAPVAMMSDIVAVADAFVSLLSHRSPRAARVTPYDAMSLMLGRFGERFHPALRAALVRAVGVYPPGQVVELDDGTIVRVMNCDPGAPERPIVAPARAAGGAPTLASEHELGPLPPGRSVRRALPYEEWPGAKAA